MEAALQLSPMNTLSLKPNPTTHITLLDKCSTIDEAKQVHAQLLKTGFVHETIPASNLLTALCRTSKMTSNGATYPLKFFDTIKEPNTFMYNTIIREFSHGQNSEQSFLLYCQMLHNAIPHNPYTFPFLVKACNLQEIHQIHCHIIKLDMAFNLYVANSLVHVYAKFGHTESARSIFDRIQRRDAVSWNSLIEGYIRHGQIEAGRELFDQMRGKNVVSWTTMINGYVKSCLYKGALELFEEMQESGVEPDKVTLACMLSAYAQLGALERGRWIDTFTAVLTACSYSGLIEEGKSLFKRIMKSYERGPSIEHYGCMVDLLGRAGLLQEAEDMIAEMPMEPNTAVWGALLTACRVHRDYNRGVRVGNILTELEPGHSGRYVTLANIYATKKEWKQGADMRKKMKEREVIKLPGSSLITLNGRVHEFVAGDRSHAETETIYDELSKILKRLREEHYVPDTEELLLDLAEEEKETAIRWHSEKLAIAFGIIKTEPGATIRIIKNLRICQDCHNVAMLISKVYDRKIIMRDRKRYHIFEDGQCSCNGYW